MASHNVQAYYIEKRKYTIKGSFVEIPENV